MINSIRIQGFKRFKENEFFLSPLTILSGMNGAGKTTLIHSLLLAHESWRRNDKIVELNGPHGLNLGNFKDILNYSSDDTFKIILKDYERRSIGWIYSGEETDLFAQANLIKSNRSRARVFQNIPRSFQYICAERLGPRLSQIASALPPDNLEIGRSGEYCAQILYTLGNMPLPESKLEPTNRDLPRLLKPQVEQWLSRITRPLQIDTEIHAEANRYSLKYRVDEDWLKSPNIGFGISFALPIILAALCAANTGILIVENPEAHLHPAGQSEMGVFLAKMATAGMALIVETHSDHIINGIRRAIGQLRYIKHTDIAVYHFSPEIEKPPEKLTFTMSGGLSGWPPGFFDQYQIDVETLSKARRGR